MSNQTTPEIINWLLEGDPCVRWQVQRDLLGETPAKYNKTRKMIEQQGWGKKTAVPPG